MCGVLLHILRFLRYLRGDLSEKTLHGISRLDQANAAFAQSKSSTKLPSLCSTQRHNGALRPTHPYHEQRKLCVVDPVSHYHRLRTECMYSRTTQLRKKRDKSKKGPVWRSSTGESGLLKMSA
jgi:hypothetical protein